MWLSKLALQVSRQTVAEALGLLNRLDYPYCVRLSRNRSLVMEFPRSRSGSLLTPAYADCRRSGS